jgi:hypothetical protein
LLWVVLASWEGHPEQLQCYREVFKKTVEVNENNFGCCLKQAKVLMKTSNK